MLSGGRDQEDRDLLQIHGIVLSKYLYGFLEVIQDGRVPTADSKDDLAQRHKIVLLAYRYFRWRLVCKDVDEAARADPDPGFNDAYMSARYRRLRCKFQQTCSFL